MIELWVPGKVDDLERRGASSAQPERRTEILGLVGCAQQQQGQVVGGGK